MFSVDERYRGLPAAREQVVALYQSINAPHLAIPGKQAGPAQGFVVGLRAGGGLAVFVYLYLAEQQDCAVYVSGRRLPSAQAYQEEEAEALAFTESMGFMMDNTHWATLGQAQQDELLRTLPVFQKDPRLAAGPPGARPRTDDKRTHAALLGRLLSGF